MDPAGDVAGADAPGVPEEGDVAPPGTVVPGAPA